MAAKFWVGGTGTWDSSTTTHWATSTGGAGGAAVPTTGDTVTFDGSSGGGIVSVDVSISGLSLTSLTTGAFTGTLDFSVGNPNLTFTAGAFTAGGAGTQTIKLGSGTFTSSSANGTIFDFTNSNLTLTGGTATLLMTGTPNNQRTVALGGKTVSALTLNSDGGGLWNTTIASAGGTIGTLTVNGSNVFYIPAALTVSTSLVLNGTSTAPIIFGRPTATPGTVTLGGTATISWAALGSVTFTGSPTANNSLDMGATGGIIINPPSSGGAGSVFGS